MNDIKIKDVFTKEVIKKVNSGDVMLELNWETYGHGGINRVGQLFVENGVLIADIVGDEYNIDSFSFKMDSLVEKVYPDKSAFDIIDEEQDGAAVTARFYITKPYKIKLKS